MRIAEKLVQHRSSTRTRCRQRPGSLVSAQNPAKWNSLQRKNESPCNSLDEIALMFGFAGRNCNMKDSGHIARGFSSQNRKWRLLSLTVNLLYLIAVF